MAEKKWFKLPDGNKIMAVVLTSEEWHNYCEWVSLVSKVETKQLIAQGHFLFDRNAEIPDEINPFKLYHIEFDKCMVVVDTALQSIQQSLGMMDMVATIGGEEMEKSGKPPKMMLFGTVYDDFKPNIIGTKQKCYITSVQLFHVENKGYYGQVYISTLERQGRMMVPRQWMFPCKIDVDTKQFIAMEKQEGEKRQFALQDRLKNIENIERMIDLVISRIVEPPEVKLEAREMEADPDDADTWKDGKYNDPDWWKKGNNPDA